MKNKILAIFGGTSKLTGVFLAGGAITSLHTNKPINDWDLYPKSVAARNNAIHWLFESGYWCAHATNRALTFVQDECQIQLMLFDTFDTAEKIFECFDFTVCMGAFDLDSEEFTLHKKFLLHCSQRYLSFNPKTRFPYASAWRVRKYEERGYTIGKTEFFKITMACANTPITSWQELKDQMGGVYGEHLEIPETEYSYAEAIKVINAIRPGNPNGGYPDATTAILFTSGETFDYYPLSTELLGSPKYHIKINDGWEVVDSLPPKNRLVDISELYNGLKFYKKVWQDDKGEFRSIWKDSFVYKVGEEVSSGSPHIYCYQTEAQAINHFSAKYQKKHFILTLTASPDDVIVELQPRLKKCLVVEAKAI